MAILERPPGVRPGGKGVEDTSEDIAEIGAHGADDRPGLAFELSGHIPCAVCAYDLSGLSITGTCPECGSSVRLTLLRVIDPRARVLEPLVRPRLTALCLSVLSGTSFGAVLMIWAQRIADGACVAFGRRCVLPELGHTAAALLALGGLAGVGLVRPHRRTTPLSRLAGGAAILMTIAAAWQLSVTLGIRDPLRGPPYFGVERMSDARALERIIFGVLVAGAILLFRVNARELSLRSVLLRRDHEHKQRLLAVAGAMMIALAGDVLLLIAPNEPATAPATLLVTLGLAAIAVGSVLATVAMVGVLIDSRAIARTIARRPMAIRDVIRRAAGDA